MKKNELIIIILFFLARQMSSELNPNFKTNSKLVRLHKEARDEVDVIFLYLCQFIAMDTKQRLHGKCYQKPNTKLSVDLG